ncbi:MAG TPA: tetratricopeptide repeat-containing glycosyltransferase family protein [Tepidisphaeraceae bacterium]|jgi:Flp pilus assembly protein TadD|nr:tetratricopeptide repeat-containing glycosyltransferase family protein [Tepidisphaeraceae bacterium]
MKKSRLEQTFDTAVEHHQAGRIADAEVLYRHVLANQPNHADALHLLGVLAAQLDRFDDAIPLISKACVLSPNIADYRTHLGNALSGRKDYPAAIDAYRQALRLNPKSEVAHDGLGAALREIGLVDQAIASHRQALAIKPNSAVVHYNFGLTIAKKGALAEAMHCYRQAIALEPNYAEAHWNLALLQLMLGDFEQGWREYEWRWRRRNFPSLWPMFPQPRWTGQDISGKTILIHTEQGYGDAAQFVRYAPLLAERGAKVIFLCQAPLQRLMKHAQGVAEVFSTPADLPPFDVQCPMMSLPLHFNTRVNTIPANVPYLRADPDLVQAWAMKLANNSGRLKVGLGWAGSPTNKNDQFRSVALQQLAPLTRAGATFYSLQKGPASAQAANPPAGMELIDNTNDLSDFADTAAMISQLDLVITVDTAIAHIAGAMGKPAWVLIASEQDWRWLLKRDDTPWYPTLRLFRQTTPGQWPDVIERVAGALAEYRHQSAAA